MTRKPQQNHQTVRLMQLSSVKTGEMVEMVRFGIPTFLTYFQCFTTAAICYERYVLVCRPFTKDTWLPVKLRRALPFVITVLALVIGTADIVWIQYLVD